MANLIPLAVSGEIASSQPCILMSIVDATPYYLVSDVNGVPYFQPLYQDPSTGLSVFIQFATRVTVSLGIRPTGNTVLISVIGKGSLLIDPTIGRIIQPGNPAGTTTAIPLEPVSYRDSYLVACGYEYVLDQGLRFYLTDNWSATPNSMSINSIPSATTLSFYVFPVEGLVNDRGLPAGDSVFKTIYNDVLGKVTDTFLFSSQAAYLVGNGSPFQYCSNSACGPNCFGLCSGQYVDCNRQKNQTFACSVEVSPLCKFLSILPFMVPTLFCIIAFAVILARVRYHHPVTKVKLSAPLANYHLTRGVRITLVVLIMIPAVLCLIMILIATVGTNSANLYMRRICAVTNEY